MRINDEIKLSVVLFMLDYYIMEYYSVIDNVKFFLWRDTILILAMLKLVWYLIDITIGN